MIYAVLSNFDFVSKFTVKNLNKDFIAAVRGGRGHIFMKVFHKNPVFLKDGFPKLDNAVNVTSSQTLNLI